MEELKIRQIMAAKGITQSDMADRLGISQAAVAMRLKSPSQKSLQEFASVLGVSVSDFYISPDAVDNANIITTCPCCGAQLRITLSPLAPPPHTEEGTEADEER